MKPLNQELSITTDIKPCSMYSYIYSFLAGVSLVFAFAPFYYWFLAFIAPYFFLMHLQSANKPKQGFKLGMCFGLGLLGVGASWIYVSIYYYGHSNVPTAGTLTLLFVSFMALFYGGLGSLYVYLSKSRSTLQQLILFSSLWILFEYLRSYLFTGFPWLLIGDTAVKSPLMGFVPILGAYGVGFIILCISSLIYYRKYFSTKILMIILLLIVSLSIITQYIPWTYWNKTKTNVVLIQGNIPQSTKWSSDQEQKIISQYLTLSQPYWKPGNVIIWPESAITLPLPYSKQLINDLHTHTENTHASLILGIPKLNKNKQIYNTLLALNNNTQKFYIKEHLVPFGEYIPFSDSLRGLINFFNLPMSSFSSNKNLSPILSAQQLLLKPAICYEIAYSNLVLEQMQKSNALLTVSNDTWFGNSLGPYQHLQIAQMRALESGRYVIRATNDGITAVINQHGSIIKQLPRAQAAALQTTVKGYSGWTPIMFYGNHTVIILITLTCLYAALRKTKQPNL